MILKGDRCQCTACKLYFNSTKAFDKHRTGQGPHRRCRTEEEMRQAGMRLQDSGFWVSRVFDPNAIALRQGVAKVETQE